MSFTVAEIRGGIANKTASEDHYNYDHHCCDHHFHCFTLRKFGSSPDTS